MSAATSVSLPDVRIGPFSSGKPLRRKPAITSDPAYPENIARHVRTASATDPTRHWASVIIVAVPAPITWKVVIDWIALAEAIAIHAQAASARCRDQQGALPPKKWPRIDSANADNGKSDGDEKEPIHFPSACSCVGQSVPRAWDNILQSRPTTIVGLNHGSSKDDAHRVNLKYQA